MRLTALLLAVSLGASAAPHRDARRADVVLMPTQQRLDGSPFVSLFDARLGEVWRWHVGAGLRHHVGLLSDQLDEQNRSIIERRVEGAVGWAVTLPYALRLGGSVPYLIDQVGVYPGYQSGPLPSSGWIDPSVWVQVSLPVVAAPWHAATVVSLDLPAGDSEAFSGRGALAGAWDLVVSWHGQALSLGAQLGYRFEPHRTLFTAVYDDHVRLLTGLSYAPKDVDWALHGELSAEVGGAPALALSAQAGVALRLGSVRVPVSGYSPLSSRPGQPAWGAAVGVVGSYRRPPDLDGDGLRGAADQCPKIAEDRDGFEDQDGCPDPDNDQDQVPDSADQCPLKAEDPDRFQDADGCPDDDNDGDAILDRVDDCPDEAEDLDGHLDLDGCPDPDQDQDGIEDAEDRCPTKPEDLDDFDDEDGCPDPDNDRDTILDADDKCPLIPENINQIDDEDGCPEPDADFDGILDPDDQCPKVKEDLDKWQDTDGCPEPDNDNDGLLDADDDCPNEAETKNGIDDEDGCPEKAVLERKRLKPHRIKARIHFRKHHWAIAKRSEQTIDLIAQLIKDHPEIVKLRIEGHTDRSGRRRANIRLSQKRADQVREALIARGVSAELLEAKGYGWTRPIDRRRGRRARRRNRRVGFLVLEVKSGEAMIKEPLDAPPP